MNDEITALRARIVVLERLVDSYADASFVARQLLDKALVELRGPSGGPVALRDKIEPPCFGCHSPGSYFYEDKDGCAICGGSTSHG